MKQLTDSAYQIGFFGSFLNVYLAERGEDLVLIDTGIGTATIDGIEKALEKQGRKLDQIKHILITHAHMDHVGGLADLQKRISAQTYAHHRDAPIIRGEKEYIYARRENLRGLAWLTSFGMSSTTSVKDPAQVDVELKEGDLLDNVLPGLRVVELPGHSYGQVGFYWPARKLLFGGDVLFHFPWGLRMPLAAVSPDWEEAKRSIKKVAAMDIEILGLGHGTPLIGGARAKVHDFAVRL